MVKLPIGNRPPPASRITPIGNNDGQRDGFDDLRYVEP